MGLKTLKITIQHMTVNKYPCERKSVTRRVTAVDDIITSAQNIYIVQ